MKTKPGSVIIASLLLSAWPVQAQTESSPAAPRDLRPIPEAPAVPEAGADYSLDLQWNERRVDATIAYENPSDQPLAIEGIQCSDGLFVVDFPKSIPARGAGRIDLLFEAKPGRQGEAEFLRLKTSAGEKLIRIAHNRPPVASFDRQLLAWEVGETAAPKSAVLTLTNGIKVAQARAMKGHAATVADLGGGRYRIEVLPKSTAKPGTFPVLVTLDPEVPGVMPVITCSIGTND
ncbi:MAG: hypothetical protein PHE83_09240 [Opitutaceae bacterium]|nr:hypothetical protein [Opitutaceae bacterium]